MNYHLITPLGTSLIRNNQPSPDFLLSLRGLPGQAEIVHDYHTRYGEHFRERIRAGVPESCAELHSLTRFRQTWSPREKPSLTLLPTDTAEAGLSCLYLQDYLRAAGYTFKIRTVAGLSYQDPREFRRTGLKNLLMIVKNEIQEARRNNLIPVINATAGFKAESSILLLLAQFLQTDVFYIHELMREPIMFQQLPVQLDPQFWREWEPVIKTVHAAGQTAAGILPIDEFHEYTRHLDQDRGALLFDIDREFGGVTLSTMGLLLVNSMHISVAEIECEDSGIEAADRIQLNAAEMSHAPRGSRQFILRLRQLDFIKKIRNEKYVNSAVSRIKGKYDSRNPGEIRIVYSDGEKGLELVVLTTAPDQSVNLQARRRIAAHMNLDLNGVETSPEQRLYEPGHLLSRDFAQEIVGLAEKLYRAEEILAQGELITRPYIQALEKAQQKNTNLRKKITGLERLLADARAQIQSLQDEVANLCEDREDTSFPEES